MEPRTATESNENDSESALTAFGLNCSLKASGASSTDLLVTQMLAALDRHGVTSGPVVRVAGSGVLAGVSSDEGDGDGWPDLRREILSRSWRSWATRTARTVLVLHCFKVSTMWASRSRPRA